MSNLEMEDLVSATNDSLKENFLALNLDFSKSTHSLMSSRDKLNKGSAEIFSNRVVKRLIIEIYGDTVCFTYPSKKQISQMVLSSTKSSPETLVESLRTTPVQ